MICEDGVFCCPSLPTAPLRPLIYSRGLPRSPHTHGRPLTPDIPPGANGPLQTVLLSPAPPLNSCHRPLRRRPLRRRCHYHHRRHKPRSQPQRCPTRRRPCLSPPPAASTLSRRCRRPPSARARPVSGDAEWAGWPPTHGPGLAGPQYSVCSTSLSWAAPPLRHPTLASCHCLPAPPCGGRPWGARRFFGLRRGAAGRWVSFLLLFGDTGASLGWDAFRR